jgi:hypothetical protein
MPGEFGIAVVAENLTDTSYRVGGYRASLSDADYYAVNVYGSPRFWGGQLAYNWGSQ